MLKEILTECILISIPILVIVGVMLFSRPETDIKFEDLKTK